jgi:hypothetical protein
VRGEMDAGGLGERDMAMGGEGAEKRDKWEKGQQESWVSIPGPEQAAGRDQYMGEKVGGGGYLPAPLRPPTALPRFHRRQK